MPLPKNRSNSVRKIHKRTPKGKTIHYKRKKKGDTHKCGLCHSRLQGVASSRAACKSMKVPNRKFAGNLCGKCTDRVLRVSSRLSEGSMEMGQVEVRMMRYIKK